MNKDEGLLPPVYNHLILRSNNSVSKAHFILKLLSVVMFDAYLFVFVTLRLFVISIIFILMSAKV